MNLSRPSIFLAFLLWVLVAPRAWTADTLRHSVSPIEPVKPMEEIVRKFPSLRLVDVQYEYATPVGYRSHQNGQSIEEGRLQLSRVKVALNLPFYKKDDWWFGASARYRYGHHAFHTTKYTLSDLSALHYGHTLSSHFYSTGLNAVRVSTLFKKRIIYGAGASIEGSEKDIERVVGNVFGMMYLKKTENTQFTLGLFGRIHKGMDVPVVPFFGVEQKLSRSWVLSVVVPKHLYFRALLSRYSRLSLGAEADADAYYQYPEASEAVYLFRKIDLKSGFLYEYLLPKKFVLSLRGGMVSTLKACVTRKNSSFSNAIVKHSQDPAFFLNAGISYCLF